MAETSSYNFNPLIAPAYRRKCSIKGDSGKDIQVNIEIDAGVAVSNVQSPSHEIADPKC